MCELGVCSLWLIARYYGANYVWVGRAQVGLSVSLRKTLLGQGSSELKRSILALLDILLFHFSMQNKRNTLTLPVSKTPFLRGSREGGKYKVQ